MTRRERVVMVGHLGGLAVGSLLAWLEIPSAVGGMTVGAIVAAPFVLSGGFLRFRDIGRQRDAEAEARLAARRAVGPT